MDINVEGYTIRKWHELEEACSNESGVSADGLPGSFWRWRRDSKPIRWPRDSLLINLLVG